MKLFYFILLFFLGAQFLKADPVEDALAKMDGNKNWLPILADLSRYDPQLFSDCFEREGSLVFRGLVLCQQKKTPEKVANDVTELYCRYYHGINLDKVLACAQIYTGLAEIAALHGHRKKALFIDQIAQSCLSVFDRFYKKGVCKIL